MKPLMVSDIEVHYKIKVPGKDKVQIRDSKSVFQVLKESYDINTTGLRETFWVLYLNRSNRINGRYKLSEGGIIGTVADVRLILQGALLTNSTSIILSHNHPSGNLKASESDVALTNQVKEAAKMLNIDLLDHVIVNDSLCAYYSFRDEGLI